MPRMKRTGTVKTTPAFTVFTEEATVWKMLTSRIEPTLLLKEPPMPRRSPNPITAATVEPTIPKPICRLA